MRISVTANYSLDQVRILKTTNTEHKAFMSPISVCDKKINMWHSRPATQNNQDKTKIFSGHADCKAEEVLFLVNEPTL